MRRLRWAALAALVAAACSSFSASKPDETTATPGVDGGPDGDVGVGDGGAGAGDGTITDGGTPSCAKDAIAPACAEPVATIVVGFDEAAFPPAGFVDKYNRGTVARGANGAGEACGPGSLRASAMPTDAGSAHAFVERIIQSNGSRAKLSFSFRGPVPVAETYQEIGCALIFDSEDDQASTTVHVELFGSELRMSAYVLETDGGRAGSSPDVALDLNVTPAEAATFRTIEAEFSASSTTVTTKVYLDGALRGSEVFALRSPHERYKLQCGIVYASSKYGSTYEMAVDDVRLELCP